MPFCPLLRKISSTEDRSLKEGEGRKRSPVDRPSKPRNRGKKCSQNPSICFKLCQRHVRRFYQTSSQENSLAIYSAKKDLQQFFLPGFLGLLGRSTGERSYLLSLLEIGLGLRISRDRMAPNCQSMIKKRQ